MSACMFCLKSQQDGSFALILRRALYCKYSQSQNYYYEKDINDLLEDNRVEGAIRFKDYATLFENIEFLKRFYRYKETQDRYGALMEYYKYHINIPRIFMSSVVGKRHEKHRQIIYKRIKVELGIKDENQKSKKQTKDSSDDRTVGQMKNLLKDLKIESTQPDLSRVTNSTILKDLVQLIGDQKTKPFQLFKNQKELVVQKPQPPKLNMNALQSQLMKTIQKQILEQRQAPQTARQNKKIQQKLRIPSKMASTDRKSKQCSTDRIERQVIKDLRDTGKIMPFKMKSRQSSMGNIQISQSSLKIENIAQFAKKIISTQSQKSLNKKGIQPSTNNFFVKGSKQTSKQNLYLEDLKNSMRSLRSRLGTPSKQCSSNVGSPCQKKK